ncbi:hypothetical protein CDO38_34105, partial [Pseudomonas aeruginosa]
VSVQQPYWTLPTGYLSGAAAASGIALINSLAAVGLLGACLLARLKTSGSSSVPLRARQAG